MLLVSKIAAKVQLFFESSKRFWNFYRVWRKIFTEFGGKSCKNICYYEQKARKTTFADIQLLTISFKAFCEKNTIELGVLLPSLAGNFYRVWRKYIPLTSTDVHGNAVYKSKYVNTSKNSFVRRADFLPLPFIKFHFFKYIFVYICSVQIKALPLQSKSNENG